MRRRRTPAAAQRRRKPNPAFPWLIRAVAGLRSMPVARVSHWGTRRGAAGYGEGRAAVGAARRNRARRRAARWGLWGALQTRVASVKVQRGLGGAHRGVVVDGEAT